MIALSILAALLSAAAPVAPPAEEEVNLDDVKIEAPKPVISVGDAKLGASLLGRFDLNYEWRNPGMKYPEGNSALTSYHNFLFVKAQAGNVSFLGEVTRLLFYEGRVKFNDQLRGVFGKIQVPFGAPNYHRYYGGKLSRWITFIGLVFGGV